MKAPFTLLLAFLGVTVAAGAPPNFILINCDDLGYADIGPFGSKLHRTPNLDRMAREGGVLQVFTPPAACAARRGRR